jgi:hypothetical protein
MKSDKLSEKVGVDIVGRSEPSDIPAQFVLGVVSESRV